MWKSAVVAVCLLAAVCSGAPSRGIRRLRPHTGGRIVGGEPVDISQYPWQVSLQDLGSHLCGASIISSTWVLTAAHCLFYVSGIDVAIRAGTSTRESGGTLYPVEQAIDHENYDYLAGNDFDIAVILIAGSFSFGSNVQAVTLATSEPAVGTKVDVSGWGDLSYDGMSPEQLQAVTTTIVSRDSCIDSYGEEITDRMICAGEPGGGKGPCHGDSGGPLVEGSTQYGIVSFGRRCTLSGYPGVYTNIAALRSWITEKTGA